MRAMETTAYLGKFHPAHVVLSMYRSAHFSGGLEAGSMRIINRKRVHAAAWQVPDDPLVFVRQLMAQISISAGGKACRNQ